MSAPPGWYQEAQRPPGHLRYWDGQRWTEQRHALPAPAAPGVPGTRPARSSARTWLTVLTVLTVLLVLLGLGLAGSVTTDGDVASEATSAEGPGESEPRETGPQKSEPEPPSGIGRKSQTDATEDEEPAGGRDRAKAEQLSPALRSSRPVFLVSRIIDGDTIELGNGETVRLLGIDTPELGECGFDSASQRLAALVLGERVRLTRAGDDRDGYGRLLRYVDLGDMDAGLRLIKSGRAIAAYDSRDGYGSHPREPVYVASDRRSTNLCPRMATGTQPAPATQQPAPKRRPSTGGGSGRSCAAGYDPCLPVVGDLDCPDVGGPVRVTGSDPYRLDADGDGIGCDS